MIANVFLSFSQNNFLHSLTNSGDILWTHSISTEQDPFRSTNPVLTPEGNIIWIIYTRSGVPYTDIICFSPDGDTIWKKNFFEHIETDPMVVPQKGWIIVGSQTMENYLYCLNADGTERWKRALEFPITQSPVIDTSLNIYYSTGTKIFARDSTGLLLWEYDSPAGRIATPLSINTNGVIYFGTEIDRLVAVQGLGNTIFNKTLFGYVRGAPSIDLDGNIFMSSSDVDVNQSKIEVFSPSGEPVWDITFNEPNPSGVCIGDSNFIYVRTMNLWGGGFGKLYKVNKSTQETKWTFNYGPNVLGARDLALDANGTIYFTTGNGYSGNEGRYYAINPNGSVKWEVDTYEATGHDIGPENHMLIGKNGNIFALGSEEIHVPSYLMTIYLIAISEPDAMLSNSAWPMFKHDQHYSGLGSDTLHAQPNISINPDYLNFGFVNLGDTASEYFTVSNSGVLPLELEWALSSSVFNIDSVLFLNRTSAILLEGDSLQFIINFSSLDTALYCDTVFFFSNDPDQPEATVILKAKTSIEGEINWKLALSPNLSGPTLDDEGNIYLSGSHIWSVDNLGMIRWVYEPQAPNVREDFSNISLSHDNQMAYIPYGDQVIALNRDGEYQWTFDKTTQDWVSALAVNSNGNLVFSDNANYGGGNIYCIDKYGKEIWNYYVGYNLRYAPAIDQNMNIFCGGILGNNAKIISIDPDGNLNWEDEFMPTCPVTIGFEDMILIGGNWGSFANYLPKIRAYHQDGTLLWTYPLPDEYYQVSTSIVVDESGNLYFGASDFLSANGLLFCLDGQGNYLWSKEYNGAIYTTPAITKNGSIYFGCKDGNFYVLDSNGTERWHIETGSAIISSPAINDEGIIYFVTDEGYLYSVFGENGGLANSPWPMVQHDAKHTSSTDSITVSVPESTLGSDFISLAARPNPFFNEVMFIWIADEPELAHIRVYDLLMHEIAYISVKCINGINTLKWKSTDTDNIQINPGIYICTLTLNGKRECIKLIKK